MYLSEMLQGAQETAFGLDFVRSSFLKENERLLLQQLMEHLEECILRKGNKYVFFQKFVDPE